MATKIREIHLETSTQFEVVDITDEVLRAVKDSKVKNGMVLVYSPHTTASIRINHNEPLLMQDILKMIYRLVPIDISYAHDFFEIRSKVKPHERSNGHAHVKGFLLGQSETIPLEEGDLVMGERQSIFFVELDGGRKRRVIVQVLGS